MSTTFTMLNTINAALLAHGQEPVTQNDGSLEWRTLSANWPFIVESELEDGNYHFTKEESTVVTYTTGKFGFDYAYPMPVGALHVSTAWREDASGYRYEIDWCQDGTAIHTDEATGVVIQYVVSADPATWTANFATGVKMMIEAHILRALKEEYGEAQAVEQKAMFHFQRARTKSSSRRSKNSLRAGDGSILRARRQHG